MSLPPTPFDDILPDDYLQMILTGQVVDDNSGMISWGSDPVPAPGGGLAPTHPMYDGTPHFQNIPHNTPSVERPASWPREDVSQSSSSSLLQTPPPLPSSSSIESPTSWDPTWYQSSADPTPFCFPPTPSLPSTSKLEFPIPSSPTCSQSSAIPLPDLSHFDLDADSEEEEEPRNFTGPLRRERDRAGRCAAVHPYKRPPGTGYNAMMATLSGDLQEQVKSEYECCAKIDMREKSTRMKHWFSNNHFRTAVGEELFHLQPMFVCPAFIAMMLGCGSAKGGRFDAACRHCSNCQTYKDFANESLENGMVLSPLLLTRGEFEAIQDFRKEALPGQPCLSPRVQHAVFELLKMMVTSRVATREKENLKGKGKAKA